MLLITLCLLCKINVTDIFYWMHHSLFFFSNAHHLVSCFSIIRSNHNHGHHFFQWRNLAIEVWFRANNLRWVCEMSVGRWGKVISNSSSTHLSFPFLSTSCLLCSNRGRVSILQWWLRWSFFFSTFVLLSVSSSSSPPLSPFCQFIMRGDDYIV